MGASDDRSCADPGGASNTNIEAFDALAGHYDRIYDTVDWEDFARQWQLLIEPRLHRASHERPPLLVEVGCGTGRLLQEWIALGYDVIGVDASAAMLGAARRRLSVDSSAGHWVLERGDLRTATVRPDEGLADVAVAPMNFVHLLAPADLPVAFSNIASFVRVGAPLLLDFAAPWFIRETGPVDDEFAPGVRVVAALDPNLGELQQRWLLEGQAVRVQLWLHEVATIRQAAARGGWSELGVWHWAPDEPAHPWKVWNDESPRGVFAFARST